MAAPTTAAAKPTTFLRLDTQSAHYKWLVASIVLVAGATQTFAGTSVNIIIPRLMSAFGTDLGTTQWVATAFLLTRTLVMPLLGWLGGVMGNRNMFVAMMVGFVVTSAGCGLATSLPMMIGFRLVQGLVLGSMEGLTAVILVGAFPDHQRGLDKTEPTTFLRLDTQSAHYKWLVASIVLVAGATQTFAGTSVNIIIPRLMSAFGTDLGTTQWVATAFLLTRTLVMPLLGWLGGVMGNRNMFVAMMVGFVVTSAGCGLATSLPMMIGFRLIQGLVLGAVLAGAPILPLSQDACLSKFHSCTLSDIPTGEDVLR